MAAGTFVAPEDLYLRVVDDLAAIRALEPMLEDHHARWPWGGGIFVSFDDQGTARVAVDAYDGWDCPNERYEAVVEPVEIFDETVFLSVEGKRVDMGMLAAEYLELPHVIATDAGGNLDSSTICLREDGSTNRYLFAEGSGDCPSECTEWVYWEYAVDDQGSATFVEELAEPTADWVEACPHL